MTNHYELPKFDNPERDIAPEKMELMLALDGVRCSIKSHQQQYDDLNLDMEVRQLLDNPMENYSLVFERRLSSEMPHVSLAFQGLKQAFDRLRGWHVSWNQWSLAEPVGTISIAEGQTTSLVMKRGSAQAIKMEGYLLESTISADEFTAGGLKTWLQIGDRPDQEFGMLYDFDEMQAIRLDPAK